MLGIGHPDRHALRRITLSKTHQPCRALPPARAGSFIDPKQSLVAGDRDSEKCSTTEVDGCPQIGPPWWKKASSFLCQMLPFWYDADGRPARRRDPTPSRSFSARAAGPVCGPTSKG
jgi:hypothetical protein